MVDTTRRDKIRSAVAAQRAAALQIRDQLVDAGMKEQFTLPLHFLDDVDRFFLDNVDAGRSADQETFWLGNAENMLQIATGMLQRLIATVQKFGGPENVRTVG